MVVGGWDGEGCGEGDFEAAARAVARVVTLVSVEVISKNVG